MLRLAVLSVPVILVGLAVFVIFVIALFKSGPFGRWIFVVFAVPVILMLFYMFFAFQPRQKVVHSEPPAACRSGPGGTI